KPGWISRARNFSRDCASLVEVPLFRDQVIPAQERPGSSSRTLTSKLTKETGLAVAALTSGAIQGLCVFAVAINAVKVTLGFTSVAAAGSSSLVHSDVVRFSLRYVSAALATVT